VRRKEPFFWLTLTCGLVIVAYILLPLIELMTSPSMHDLWEGIQDKNVARSIGLSVYTAGSAAAVSFLFGTPLAYFLARQDFKGKRFLEAVIDLPIIIPIRWSASPFWVWQEKTTGSVRSSTNSASGCWEVLRVSSPS
jgi:molybdate/tungstate transport system permease protein